MRTGMFLDKSKETPEIRTARKALQDLVDVSGTDTVSRLSAEFTAPSAVEAWRSWGYKLSSGTPCVCRLIHGGGGCTQWSTRVPESSYKHEVPGADHTSLLLKGGKPALLLTQPYSLSHEDIQELVAFADKSGLEISIRADVSTHFPGHTLAVALTKKKENPHA